MPHRVSAPPSRFSYRQLLRATACQSILSPTLVAVVRNDLYRFSPTNNTWTALAADSPPSARVGMGFAATPDGLLYVFGGYGGSGERRVWGEGGAQEEGIP